MSTKVRVSCLDLTPRCWLLGRLGDGKVDLDVLPSGWRLLAAVANAGKVGISGPGQEVGDERKVMIGI